MNQETLLTNTTPANALSWLFAALLVIIGVLNIVLVHAVPGVAYLLVALLYAPPVNALLREKVGFGIPGWLKIVLGILIMQFTLGVSDLGDMLDKWAIAG